MRGGLVLILGTVFVGQLSAADQVDYAHDIKPLLAHKCGACHGVLKQEAGLRLDAGVLIRKGGEDGAVVTPGDAAKSRLIHRVSTTDVDVRMPPEGAGTPLDEEQVALLAAWINAGAPIPDDESISVDPRSHWAYQVPIRPEVPHGDDNGWSQPIDAFIAYEHQRMGLTAVPTADRHTLLRRAYIDLIGLPPTREQIDAFVSDTSPDAWQKVVDSLLESPRYGERWGRHWMDVWRYSDWDGYKNQLRGSQRHIWRWRDWIVNSLNSDKGYDRMITEMLAGDEVAPGDADVLPATGFLARNYHNSNRNIWLDATVEHTSKAFLGVTLNCARCHDHKFDPLPQTAYYQFRAIFEPHRVRTDRLPGELDIMKAGIPRAFDADLAVETFLYEAGNEKRPDKEHPMTPAVPEVLGGTFEVRAIDLPLEAYYPDLCESVFNDQLAIARKQQTAADKAVAVAKAKAHDAAKLASLELKQSVARLKVESLLARRDADLAKFAGDNAIEAQQLAVAAAALERQLSAAQAAAVVDQKSAAKLAAESSDEKDPAKKKAAIDKASQELKDAEKKRKAAEAELAKTDSQYTPLGKEHPHSSTGWRTALARWITSTDNPLTARVAVNQIWMRHFGSPLVENVFDFGLRSKEPRQKELLDWLAVEFMENNWSMKHLHRLIVTSRTWQLASSASGLPIAEHNQSIDQDNHYYWRANVRRLDAEIIRDSVLAVAGELDATLGGSDIDFHDGETSRRRSIYLRHAYEKQMTMLVLFDAANPTDCYRRSESIVPQQALALSNSSLSMGRSRVLAGRLWEEAAVAEEPNAKFIDSAFLQVLSRAPDADEMQACRQFLSEQSATLTDLSKLTTFPGGDEPKVKPADDPQQRARENLIHVLMNHNDFVTIR